MNRDPNINFRPFYYADIRVDPHNPEPRLFALGLAVCSRRTAARTSAPSRRDVHGDHQAMWIDPTDPNRILEGSDGGWQMSFDGGRTWEVVNTFPFTQFYHINYDMQKPYHVCGGLQDNGNWCGPSHGLHGCAIGKPDWFTVSGGDGFFTVSRTRQAVARLLRRAGWHDLHHRHRATGTRRRSTRIRTASARSAT